LPGVITHENTSHEYTTFDEYPARERSSACWC